ncbi:MAG: protein translocase subunit SecD, partial [Actinomycetota bacterium]|nr:protein translocase subunit SecD [Actinomycetota bacterium]
SKSTIRMRNKKINIFIIAIFIILIGVSFYYIFRDSVENSINLGLDLKGGTQIVLKPVAKGEEEITSEKINHTISIIRDRIDRLGVSEPLITKDLSNNIVVQLPGVEDLETAKEVIGKTAKLEFRLVTGMFFSLKENALIPVGADYENGELLIDPDAEEVLLIDYNNQYVGNLITDPETGEHLIVTKREQTENEQESGDNNHEEDGKKEEDAVSGIFEYSDEEIMGKVEYNPDTRELLLIKNGEEAGEILVDSRSGIATLVGPVLITGDGLAEAVAGYDNYGNIRVALSFKGEAVDKFAEVTSENIGKNLAIVLDEEIESAPVIKVAITNGSAEITGIESIEEAKNIELVLQTGAFPIDLQIEESSMIGPTLGMDSLIRGLYAGLIGLILVIVFMLIYYKGLGIYASVGLIVYIILFWGTISAIGAALTLPGIAGIILTIGMAVDANVIIFERIKEEIIKGKSSRIAINDGFKNAIRTIVDSNVTTLITAGALYIFGTGPIKGFAVTLGLGVIISMMISLLFNRSIIFLMAGVPRLNTPGFLGVRIKGGV